MDYKKIIIINLACLIILGKILVFTFNKMQKGLNFINIKDNSDLLKNVNFNSQNIEESKFYEQDNSESFIGNKYNITLLQQFYNDYRKINFNDLSTEEIREIIYKINLINHYVKHVKKQKLKVFLFIIFMIIFVNYIATKKFILWNNLVKVKEKVKNILVKIDKYDLNSRDDIIFNSDNLCQDILPKKNEFSKEKLLIKKKN